MSQHLLTQLLAGAGLAITVFMASCSADGVSTRRPPFSPMRANIDGMSWAATPGTVTIALPVGSQTIPGFNALYFPKRDSVFIAGIQGGNRTSIVFSIKKTGGLIGPHRFTGVPSNELRGSYGSVETFEQYPADTGTVVITSIDTLENTLSGTFNFRSQEGVNGGPNSRRLVTNGTFNGQMTVIK